MAIHMVRWKSWWKEIPSMVIHSHFRCWSHASFCGWPGYVLDRLSVQSAGVYNPVRKCMQVWDLPWKSGCRRFSGLSVGRIHHARTDLNNLETWVLEDYTSIGWLSGWVLKLPWEKEIQENLFTPILWALWSFTLGTVSWFCSANFWLLIGTTLKMAN